MLNSCPVCTSHSATRIFTLVNKDVIWRCSDCLAQWRQAKKPLDNFYNKSYFADWDDEKVTSMKEASFSKSLRRLGFREEDFKGARVLDVGSGNGALLKLLSGWGSMTTGIELSGAGVEMAVKNVPGAKIIHNSCMTVRLKELFDYVILTDLVEHVEQTRELFNRLATWLERRGYIIFTTPDPYSLFAKILGRYWPHYTSEHLVFLSKKAIRKLAEDNGLTTVKIIKNKKVYTAHFFLWQIVRKEMHPFISLAKILLKLLPDRLQTKQFSFATGEHLVLMFRGKR